MPRRPSGSRRSGPPQELAKGARRAVVRSRIAAHEPGWAATLGRVGPPLLLAWVLFLLLAIHAAGLSLAEYVHDIVHRHDPDTFLETIVLGITFAPLARGLPAGSPPWRQGRTHAGAAGARITQWRRRVDRGVQRYPFLTFVVVAYAFSWSLWGVAYAGGGDAHLLAGVFGPAVAAAFVLRRTGGSLREWGRSCVRWRAPLRWWAYALGLPIALYAAVSVALQVAGRPVDWTLAVDRAPAYAATWLFVLLVGGAMEEPGWRGYGLPHLLESHTPLRATLLLGLVWGVWHVPLYGPLGFVVPMVLAFFYTYLWARTRSALLAILMHASFTPAQDHLILLPRDQAYSTVLDGPDVAVLGVYLVAAVALLVLTHGRLGVETDDLTARSGTARMGDEPPGKE